MSVPAADKLRRSSTALGLELPPTIHEHVAATAVAAADLLDAIDVLHQPEHSVGGTYCCLCIELWPCETHVLLHPVGGPS